MLERAFGKVWAAEQCEKHPRSYWLRLPDSADGIKPFDGILFRGDGLAIAVEFKVWRLKRPFDGSSVKPHQMRELLLFDKGENRMGMIVVYFERTGETRQYKPSAKVLKRLLRRVEW